LIQIRVAPHFVSTASNLRVTRTDYEPRGGGIYASLTKCERTLVAKDSALAPRLTLLTWFLVCGFAACLALDPPKAFTVRCA
jgi:hypothetical protein